MKKILFGCLPLLAVCCLCACGGYEYTTVTLPDGFAIRAALADTPQKSEKGLMFVKHLPADEGMLFVFEREDEHYFWMKNTLIDLDIIFLDPQGRITVQYERVPHTYTYTPDSEIPFVAACRRATDWSLHYPNETEMVQSFCLALMRALAGGAKPEYGLIVRQRAPALD